MPKLAEIDFFDPVRIETLNYAIGHVLEILLHQGELTSEQEDKKLISLCVVHQMRLGEENRIRIVNKAISDFRRRTMLNKREVRQSDVQAR